MSRRAGPEKRKKRPKSWRGRSAGSIRLKRPLIEPVELSAVDRIQSATPFAVSNAPHAAQR